MVTVFHHTPVNTFSKQFDGLNFDNLAGKFQNIKIFPIKILRYMLFSQNSHVTKINVIAIPHMCDEEAMVG